MNVAKAFGAIMIPLSVVPFVAVRGDVIREHDAYVAHWHPPAPIGAAPAPPLPGRAPAPPLESPVRPSIQLGRGASVTLGAKNGDVLIDVTKEATSEGRRLLVDANGDGAADVAVGAGARGVKIVACQTSVDALATAGSGRRADGGTTVHLPARVLGGAPRILVSRGPGLARTCAGPSFARSPIVALPGGTP